MHSSIVKTSQISRHLKLCTTRLCRINECYIGWLMFVLSCYYLRKNILIPCIFRNILEIIEDWWLPNQLELYFTRHFLHNLGWNFYLFVNKLNIINNYFSISSSNNYGQLKKKPKRLSMSCQNESWQKPYSWVFEKINFFFFYDYKR